MLPRTLQGARLVSVTCFFLDHTPSFDQRTALSPKDRARAQQLQGKYTNDPLRPTAICQQAISYLQCLPKEHNSSEKQIGTVIFRTSNFMF